MKCSHCDDKLDYTFIDLGKTPLSNSYLTHVDLRKVEKYYPLRVKVCEKCWLVQTEKIVTTDQIFSGDYAYFSSFSTSWLDHVRRYVDQIILMLALNHGSTVVEIGANDGYLLQYMRKKNIPCYGIEPTHNTALAARKKGIEIIEEFFNSEKAKELALDGRQADVIIANNVLAHVPDINDFVRGFSMLLKSGGIATFEFPHLLNLVRFNQFDTIYHEHHSYLSLTTTKKIFSLNGLNIFKVEKLLTHGGSLRVFAQRIDSGKRIIEDSVKKMINEEFRNGITTLAFYEGFQKKANIVKDNFVSFVSEIEKRGEKVVGYGASANGNTLFNFADIGPDLIPYVIDRNPLKQGKFLPGSGIPVVSEDRLKLDCPEYVAILPWNLKKEITHQLSYITNWGGKLVTAVPELEIQS